MGRSDPLQTSHASIQLQRRVRIEAGGNARVVISRSARVWIFLAAYSIVSLISANVYLAVPPSPDQSLFDYMAWLRAYGGRDYYAGTFDMTWPGQLVLHELAVRVFGVHAWTARAGDFVALQGAVAAIYFFLRRADAPIAAVIAALCYPIIYVTSGGWMAGHRDIVAMHFLIGGAALLIGSPGKRLIFISAMLVGYATMIRPTYLASAPALFAIKLFDWWREEEKQSLAKIAFLFGSGVCTPAILFGAYGYWQGALDDWFRASLQFPLLAYQVDEPALRLVSKGVEFLRSVWWLALSALAGALVWISSDRNKQPLWLVGALLLTAIVSYTVQNKGFGYHLGGLIPLLMITAAAGSQASLKFPRLAKSAKNIPAAAVTILLLVGCGMRLANARIASMETGQLTEAEKRDIVSIVRAESSSAEPFFQWGWNYDVAFRVQRPVSTRLINTPALSLIRPDRHDFREWISEFEFDLANCRPTFILVGGEGTGRSWAGGVLEQQLQAHYSVRKHLSHGTLHQLRQGHPTCAAAPRASQENSKSTCSCAFPTLS